MPVTRSASPLVRHFFTFRYRFSEDRPEVIEHLLAQGCLKPPQTGMPYIVSIETGKATSHEGLDQGMVDGFLMTFNSEADHNFYFDDDPVHKEFQRFVASKLDQEACSSSTSRSNAPRPFPELSGPGSGSELGEFARGDLGHILEVRDLVT